MSERYRTIGDAVTDPLFAELDLALRRGCHVCEDDLAWFTFLNEARLLLDEFYDQYGWDLVYLNTGIFYLLPRNDSLGGAHLSSNAMLVGQVCLLLYLDSATTRTAGRVSRQQILEMLSAVVGEDKLAERLTGRAGRRETRQIELVHQRLGGALKELRALGLVNKASQDEVELRQPLIRFADPVLGDGDYRSRLETLARTGAVQVQGDDELDEEWMDATSEG